MAREGRFELDCVPGGVGQAAGWGSGLSRSWDPVAAVGAGDGRPGRLDGTGVSRRRNATNGTQDGSAVVSLEHRGAGADRDAPAFNNHPNQTVSVAEAARLLGRDRTRVYALLRSGDLVAAPAPEADEAGPVRIVRASLERWLVAGGARGGPLTPRNAWALIGLASRDQVFSERCLGLLERAEELSRTRARVARESLVDLARACAGAPRWWSARCPEACVSGSNTTPPWCAPARAPRLPTGGTS